MHVIFDRSHVTVHNVHCATTLFLPARLVTGFIYWMVAVLPSVDAPLAIDSLSLTDLNLYD